MAPDSRAWYKRVVSIVVTGHYYHEPNEINSLVSSEHNGTNMIYGKTIILTCDAI